jgi:hypothetical protein
MDPAAAAERLEHSDRGALFLKTYGHLYEGKKRSQAARLDAMVRAELDKEGTRDRETPREGRSQADSGDGQYWDRTSDPSRVRRVLSR